MNFKTSIGALRIIGLLEGISFLSFLITMPLKYVYEIELPNKIVGGLHGFLFIAFVFLVFYTAKEVKWSIKNQLLAYLSSLLPFGTFVVDAKIFKPTQQQIENK